MIASCIRGYPAPHLREFDLATLDSAGQGLLELIRRAGFEVALANLSTETVAVVLALAYRIDRLVCGASAGDPRTASVKALTEAARSACRPRSGRRVSARDVVTPRDHEAFYERAAAVDAASFLWSSSGSEVSLGSLPVLDVATLGPAIEVDLSSSLTSPFAVVRSLAPGLIPMSFGFDREPMGLPAAKRALGERTMCGPLTPHPFA